MPTPHPTRREFLKQSGRGLGVLALSHYASSLLTSSAFASDVSDRSARRTLVIVQLEGGNDGLNTVIPFEDVNYYRLRPTLALPKSRVLPISDRLGLHPACALMQTLHQEGKITVVQNVGYARPSLSHARSAEIWATASDASDVPATGWLGRYLDSITEISLLPGNAPGLYLDEKIPLCLRALDETRIAGFSSDLRLQALARSHQTTGEYPANRFGNSLRHLAALIAAGAAPRVCVVSLGGFDTHGNQANVHENLLRILSEGLHAFQRDLESLHADRSVLTMTCSEFGRSPAENESRGTGHGTVAPVFLMGSALQVGIIGTAPSLELSAGQQLEPSTDFRQIYATVLEDWLACPPETILGSPFDKLAFLTSAPASDHATQRSAGP